MSQPKPFVVEQTTGVSGRFTPIVLDAKTGKEVKRYPTQDNIILDVALDRICSGSSAIWNQCIYCFAGTGTTPTKDITSSSYTQTGTTVTRAGGSFAFTSGMVGRRIVFSDGQQAKITAVGSATSATVDVSQTVPKAERPKTITSISSTATDFTVLATAHGLRVGDRITISGASVSGYNATWTVDVVNNPGSFTVTEISNFGAATGGTFVKAACLAALFRTDRTQLANETKYTDTRPNFVDPADGYRSQATIFDSATKTLRLRFTYDFAEETSNINYTEIGVGQNRAFTPNPAQITSIVLLAGAVTVESGQLLRVIYELQVKHGGPPNEQPVITDPIAGWPRPYNVSSITSTGSAFTVTLAETHHYKAGGKITLTGIRKPRFAVTAATSTSTNFTLTAPGHTFSGGNVIAVEGMTPTGYNGTFTIASVAGDDIVVTSTLNPGTGTIFGTVRINEPQATPITGIVSDFDTFTITAPGNTISGGDTITVRGVTPNGYNGAWTVASVSGDEIIVNDTRNLGAGTGGTVNERNQVWYDDEWTIASVGSTTVVVNSTLNLGTVNTNEGVATNNVRRKLVYCNYGINRLNSNFVYYDTRLIESNFHARAVSGIITDAGGSGEFWQGGRSVPLFLGLDAAPSRPTRWPVSYNSSGVARFLNDDTSLFPNETGLTPYNIGSENAPNTDSRSTYVTGSFTRDEIHTYGVTRGNLNNIRSIVFSEGNQSDAQDVEFYIDFEEPQRKDPTHKFTLTSRRRITRNLTVDTPT